tara:strand:- start:13389 stop:13691 length:303 start_codon:yes stop_codon:yes gene_type:complete
MGRLKLKSFPLGGGNVGVESYSMTMIYGVSGNISDFESEVLGSSPGGSTNNDSVAQWSEQGAVNSQVIGSNPIIVSIWCYSAKRLSNLVVNQGIVGSNPM